MTQQTELIGYSTRRNDALVRLLPIREEKSSEKDKKIFYQDLIASVKDVETEDFTKVATNAYTRFMKWSSDVYKMSIIRLFFERGNLSKMVRYMFCGHDYQYMKCGCDYYKMRIWCGLKLCKMCRGARVQKSWNRYLPKIKKYKLARRYNHRGLRLITLTAKSFGNASAGVVFMKESFRRLRQRKYWKEKVYGGFGVMEGVKHRKHDLKFDKDGEVYDVYWEDSWHVHFHFLIDSEYLDMKGRHRGSEYAEFVYEWNKATKGRGSNVWVSPIKSHHGGTHYMVKYATKGSTFVDPEDALEWEDATFRKKMYMPFGTMIDMSKQEKPLCSKCGCGYSIITFSKYQEFKLENLKTGEGYGSPPPEQEIKMNIEEIFIA